MMKNVMIKLLVVLVIIQVLTIGIQGKKGLDYLNTLANQSTYTNPVKLNIADINVLTHGGKYYMYGTRESNTASGFEVHYSTDLVNWTTHNQLAITPGPNTGGGHFWAPNVIEKDGMFYMSYTAGMRVYIAKSSSPLGPFTQHSDGPLVNNNALDTHIFIDEDGKAYLYFCNNNAGNIWVGELSSDLKSISNLMLCFSWDNPSETWVTQAVNEGAFMIKKGNIYYLFYSANGWSFPAYSIGYATSSSPRGPWTRSPHNPVLSKTNDVHGTGHHGFAYSPDGSELFVVYHSHNRPGSHSPRKANIDRIEFIPQASGPDKVVAKGPTHTPQPMPSGAGIVLPKDQPGYFNNLQIGEPLTPEIAAEEAVAAYESVPFATLTQIEFAETLEATARAKVALLNAGTEKQALVTRIDTRKSEIDSVSKEQLIEGEISNPWVYYRFDETSGTIAKDSSGNNKNSTLINGPIWTTGKYGKAVQLDGINDYIELPENIMSTLEDFTIATWFNINTLNHGRIFDFGQGEYTDSIYPNRYITLIPYVPGSGTIRYEIHHSGRTEQFNITPTQPLQTGKWYHIAITYNKATKTAMLYLNGERLGSSRIDRGASDIGNTNQNWIGRSRYTGIDPYRDGKIDDFVIYNRVLSRWSVEVLMNTGPLVDDIQNPNIIYGDVNRDGQVTNVDLILMKRYIAGITVAYFNEEAADVNGDGKITNVDLILLQRFIAGILDTIGPQ